ncbi:MAG: hypothetical protein WCL08_00380 [Verrucomicrobiota bacterium]
MNIIKRFFSRRRSMFFSSPGPVVIGKGYNNARALHQVLACTTDHALLSRKNNYETSLQKVLDQSRHN